MKLSTKALLGIGAILGALAFLYWRIAGELVHAWSNDGNYSHGFLIPPLALYFAWERRRQLVAAAARPSWLGLALIVASSGVLLAGLLGSELFLSRVSFVGIVAGIVLFVFGWEHLRILAFPIGFLLLMIPIPALIFNQIAFPLQLLASRAGEMTMATAGIPVLREGNVLILANTTLEVAEACSGIRSLISLITLGLVFGYFTDSRAWVRTAIVLSAIPVAILANAARVAGTGVAAHWYGVAAAEGFFHEFSGWVVFIVAFLLILAVQQLIVRMAPTQTPSAA